MMYRLPAVAGEWIDRSRTLDFEFEGRAFQGFAGDTISSALAAAGEMTLGRSFKYHRPRGIFSFANHDANNLFQVGGVPNVRGDVTRLPPACRSTAVNTIGGARARSRAFHRMAGAVPARGLLLQGVSRQATSRAGNSAFARSSGLGRIGADAARERTPKRYAFCDVLVVGAGLSGLATALSAADAGARVLLVDENARAGGCGPWTGAAASEIDALVESRGGSRQHRSADRRRTRPASTPITGWRWSSLRA